MKEKRLLAATSEAVFPVNGLFDDLDGIGDGKPSALLSIDTAVDERFRSRDGRDKLVERAPAKQAFGVVGAGLPDPTTSSSEWKPVLRFLAMNTLLVIYQTAPIEIAAVDIRNRTHE